MVDWNPELYDKFKAEREQPFWDLVAMVRARPGMRAADLGCGPGRLTRALHEKIAARDTLGIDTSDSMLERARTLEGGGLRFERGDIRDFAGTWDLLFSNAALQWVPDHPRLFQRLRAALAPRGQLAVQVPANFDSAEFLAAYRVADQLNLPPHTAAVLRPEEYARLLYDLGFAEQLVQLHVYPHVLGSREDVVEWMSGTAFTAWQGHPRWPDFLARYGERLQTALPVGGPVFFPYKRILMWGQLGPP